MIDGIFAYPDHLAALLAAAILAYALLRWIPKRRSTMLGTLIKNPALRKLLTGTHAHDLRRPKALLSSVAIMLIALALAGPQWGVRSELVPSLGASLVICLDLSRSMLAKDIEPSRFERAKLELKDAFVGAERHDPVRLGLVTFSGKAYLQCPMTLDNDALAYILESVIPGSLPYPGTDISSALEVARSLLDKIAGVKHILLVTDGEDLEGDPKDEIKALSKDAIKVSVLWVGSTAGEPIPLKDENGAFIGYVKDNEGNTVISKARPDDLAAIAKATQGVFIALKDSPDSAARLRGLLQGHGANKDKDKRIVLENRFQIPLAMGLLLLALELALPERRRSKEGL